jgi:hypothetical protein
MYIQKDLLNIFENVRYCVFLICFVEGNIRKQRRFKILWKQEHFSKECYETSDYSDEVLSAIVAYP